MKPSANIFLILSILSVSLARAESLEGAIEWDNKVDLGMVVSGVIEAVAIKVGSRVKADQLLVNMEPTLFDAEVKSAQAQLARLRAEDAEQQRSLLRAEELYDRGVSSTVENDREKLAARQTHSARQQAESDLIKAKYELQHSHLLAPFDAWVLAVHVVAGQALANSFTISPVVTIAEVGRYQVVVDTNLGQIQPPRPDQQVRVTLNGQQYSARLTAIEAAQLTNHVRLKASFASDQYIAPGSVAILEME